MPRKSGDDRTEPTLELPSLKLPGRGRRRRDKAQPPEQPEAAPEPTPAAEPEPEPEPRPEPEPEPQASKPARPRRRAPSLAGPVAAPLVGAVVGLAGGAASYTALAGCEAVRGVGTCGGGAGSAILLVIVVAMILLGSWLLAALGVKDPGSTSFLAVGIVAVLSMLFLLDVMDSPWMFLVVPVLSAAAYLLAHWVTSRYADEPTGRRDWA